MKIKATNDYIFLSYEKKKDDKKRALTADVSSKNPAVVVVDAVGEKVVGVKKGMRVIIDPFLPKEITVESNKYFILREKDILGIIE